MLLILLLLLLQEQLSTGHRFTEGPAEGPEGRIWFSDIPNNRIHRYDPKSGKTERAREDSGGANGLMFDSKGRLIACEGKNRRLVRIEGEKVTVLAERYNGRRLNSPNDLDIDARGGIYFTDPRYGKRDDMEMKIEGVYYLPPDGKLIRIIDDVKRPNGIVLSPDGKRLYVADHGAGMVYVYDVRNDARVRNRRKFTTTEVGKPDGMDVDAEGNLYSTGNGVTVWNPEGKLLRKIEFPESPANCTVVGDWLYATARKSLYRARLR